MQVKEEDRQQIIKDLEAAESFGYQWAVINYRHNGILKKEDGFGAFYDSDEAGEVNAISNGSAYPWEIKDEELKSLYMPIQKLKLAIVLNMELKEASDRSIDDLTRMSIKTNAAISEQPAEPYPENTKSLLPAGADNIKDSVTIKKQFKMNQENFDYLKNQVKFTGFGEALENELKFNIEKQQPAFQLKYDHRFGKDETTSTLNFRKSDSTDMYFFNSYHLSAKLNGDKEPLEQNFYVGRDNTFTLKEGYNLLSGRAVNKDLVNREQEGYNAWVQLNFKEADNSGNYKLKHFTENYGYKVEEALEKHPIKELANAEDKGKLIESLKKGNRQSVTFLNGKTEQKRFIEANPQFKSITVYDDNMKRINHAQKTGESNEQGETKSAKAKQSQSVDEKADGEKAQKKSKKHQGIS